MDKNEVKNERSKNEGGVTMTKDFLTLKPKEFAKLPVVKACWGHSHQAILFITLQRQIAHVTFDFFHLHPHQFEFFYELFEVDYKKALQLFHRLQQENRFKKEEPIYPPLYVSYISPQEALKSFIKEV